MGTAKRKILSISMWTGWGATVILLAAIGLEVDLVHDKGLFFGRLFALLALVSAVITIGLWNEAIRIRSTIPVEEVWKAGAAYGANYARRMAALAKQKKASPTSMPKSGDVDWDTFLQTPVNQHGQQDSPPINWPPNRQ